MKTLILGITLLTSFSVFSYDQITKDYTASYHKRYSDSRGVDRACTYEVYQEKQDAIIKIDPSPTGRWIELRIPMNKLPLVEGDDFVVESVVGNMRVKYRNGILAYSINNMNDGNSRFYLKNVATMQVDPDLSNARLVDASVLSLNENSKGKVTGVTKLQNVQCSF